MPKWGEGQTEMPGLGLRLGVVMRCLPS
jgi:hypothetical protein